MAWKKKITSEFCEISAILLLTDKIGTNLIRMDFNLQLSELVCEKLPHFVSSGDLEVQERASSALHLMKYVHKQLLKDDTGLSAEMTALFAGELNPVAPKAQKKVQIPDGLDLDAWINEPLSSESSSEEEENVSQLFPKCGPFVNEYNNYSAKNKVPEMSEEEMAKVK